jgi:hypothetical protein
MGKKRLLPEEKVDNKCLVISEKELRRIIYDETWKVIILSSPAIVNEIKEAIKASSAST